MAKTTAPRSALCTRLLLAASMLAWGTVTPAALMVEDERRAQELTESFSSALPEFGLDRPQSSAQRDAIVRQLRAGDLEGAERLARDAVTAGPRDAAAQELLGVVLGLRGKPEDALVALQTAIKLAPENASALTKTGTLLMAMNRPDEAIAHFERALRVDPADRFAHQRMGMLREARNEIERAITHYEKGIVGTAPNYVGVKVALGRLYNLSGRFDQTRALLEPVADQARDGERTAHVVLGTAYLRTNKPQEAITQFRKAVAAEPTNAGFQLALAIGLRETGDPAAALPVFERAIELAPEHPEAHYQRVDTLLALERQPQALDALRALAAGKIQPLRAKSRLADVLLGMNDPRAAADILRELAALPDAPREITRRWLAAAQASGNLDEATQAAESLLARHPEDAVAHYEAARYFAFRTEYARAEEAARKALSLKKDDPEILYLLAAIEARTGKPKAAADTARRLVKLAPDKPANRFLLASVLQDSGQAKAAETEYRALLVGSPDHPLALNNLANLLADAGKLDEALALAQRASTALPENGMVLDTLGMIQHRLGQHERAVATLAKAAERLPNQGVALYHLGLAQHALGRQADALASIERALEIEPQASWAVEARARLANGRK